MRELDGARGGNLNVEEETELFSTLVNRLSGDELWRIMTVEDKGPEILAAAAQFAPPPVLFDLTHQATLHLNGKDRELALSAALTTLSTMGDAEQQAATALLAGSGTLADLLDAAGRAQAELEASQEHGHPVVEFFKGVGGAVKGIWDGVYGLTLQGLTDPPMVDQLGRHRPAHRVRLRLPRRLPVPELLRSTDGAGELSPLGEDEDPLDLIFDPKWYEPDELGDEVIYYIATDAGYHEGMIKGPANQ